MLWHFVSSHRKVRFPEAFKKRTFFIKRNIPLLFNFSGITEEGLKFSKIRQTFNNIINYINYKHITLAILQHNYNVIYYNADHSLIRYLHITWNYEPDSYGKSAHNFLQLKFNSKSKQKS